MRVKFTKAVLSNNISYIFPTYVTAITGHSLTIKLIAMNPEYYDTLDDMGFTAHRNRISVEAKTYFLYGEFLKNIMVPTSNLRQYMDFIFPDFDKKEYNSIHLRFGGKLADVPVIAIFLPENSTQSIEKCINLLPRLKKIYVASDSLKMKKELSKSIRGYDIIFSSNLTIPADTQMMKTSLVSYATFSAVAELYILGNGKQCIMTPGSTYSLAMCALTGKMPIIIIPENNTCDIKTYGGEINYTV